MGARDGKRFWKLTSPPCNIEFLPRRTTQGVEANHLGPFLLRLLLLGLTRGTLAADMRELDDHEGDFICPRCGSIQKFAVFVRIRDNTRWEIIKCKTCKWSADWEKRTTVSYGSRSRLSAPGTAGDL